MGKYLISVLIAAASAGSLSAQNVSLSVDASVNGGSPPVAGTTTTYTITVSNEGPGDAANVQLSTAVPAGTTLQSFTAPPAWSCSGTTTITCSIATFPAGSDFFTLVVNVPRATPQGTAITLDATVTTTSTDPDPNDNSVELTSFVVWQSSLAIAKSAPLSAFAGAPITYTINVTNGGPSDAADVSLSDTLPPAFIVDNITAPGWSCSGSVSCTMPQFGTSSTITIQGHTASSTPAQTLVNDVSVSASTEPSTHTASASTALTTSADLTISKSGTQPVPGNDVTYTINMTNNGPSDAASLSFHDTLPPQESLVSVTAPGWSCAGTDCTRATLAPGTSTITIVAHVAPATPPGTTIVNTATVSSATPDPTTPNTASASGTIPAPASLSATKQANGPFIETLPFTYTITLSNAGPGAQPNNAGDELTDVLPPQVTLISAGASSGTTVADVPSNTVHWNGSITAGGSVTITIQASVKPGTAGTPVSNQATFAYDATGTGTNSGSGTSNTATFTPLPASAIPAMSTYALVALGLLLAAFALRRT